MTEAMEIGDQRQHPRAPRRIGVIAAGTGAVGAHFLNVLEHRFCSSPDLELRVVAIGDSRGFICNGTNDSWRWSELNAILRHKAAGHAVSSWNGADGVDSTADVQSHVGLVSVAEAISSRHRSFDDYIVVDCTSSATIAPALIRCKALGFAVVLANKISLAGPIDQYRALAFDSNDADTSTHRAKRVRYEATVGAAIPVVDVVKRIVASQDTIHKIQGSLSGTVAYMLSGMKRGMSFSDALKEAHDLGITEADPRDDLSGADVARKMIILAREIGFDVEISSHVQINSILPPALFQLSVDAFFEQVPQFDDEYRERLHTANSQGNTLAYIGTISSDGRIFIGLDVVPSNSVFADASSTEGAISISSEWFPEPLVLRGTGAGIHSTAAALAGDVAAIIAL